MIPMTSIPEIKQVRLTCAETAKEVRMSLRTEFPGQKFSVRSKTYAGGASISISWEDGPAEDAVREQTHRFAGATFDGMTDSKNYKPSTLFANEDGSFEDIRYGADFVQCQRQISEAARLRYHEEVVKLLGQEFDESERIPVHVEPDGKIFPLSGSDEWGSTVIHRMSCARAKYGEPAAA
jgi:hypothetical protein